MYVLLALVAVVANVHAENPETILNKEELSKDSNVTKSTANCICGRKSQDPDDLEVRIVGGVLMKHRTHQFLAAIFINGKFFCGGTVVGPHHILTAAHCVDGRKEADVEVYLGLRKREENMKAVVYPVRRIIQHADYRDVNGTFVVNDIALLRVDEIKFNDKVQPICIPFENEVEGASLGMVAGWGLTKTNGTTSRLPLAAKLRILKPDECLQSKWGTAMSRIPDSERMTVCAYKPSSDACQGDSGGPLLATGFAGTIFQVGIVSFGDECANVNGVPGIYMKLHYYTDWLKEHIQGELCTRPY